MLEDAQKRTGFAFTSLAARYFPGIHCILVVFFFLSHRAFVSPKGRWGRGCCKKQVSYPMNPFFQTANAACVSRQSQFNTTLLSREKNLKKPILGLVPIIWRQVPVPTLGANPIIKLVYAQSLR